MGIVMISKLKSFYLKYSKVMENFIYPVILLLYPLVKVNQGIDVSDSTYSLGNYLFFENMKGMWVISTFLSNVVGSLLVHLPGGNTLLGMNIYTGLLVSLIVLICYYALRKIFSASVLFVGEMIAIGFCWIPTVILYNYLSYLLFAIGALILYNGLVWENNKKLFIAGVVLGLNVMVRFPNLTEAALIVTLWYACFLKRESLKSSIQKTAWCIFGYLLGFTVPFVWVIFRYGLSSFTDMLSSLSAIKAVDESYSSLSMITSVLSAYTRSFKWVLFIVVGIVLGMMMFCVLRGKYVMLKKILFLFGTAIMLRFFWGRGMFSFRYFEDYTSMFEWGMLALYLSIIASVFVLVCKKFEYSIKVMAVIVLVILIITPLGSNNYTCQNLNNLFLVMPFTIYVVSYWFKVSSYKEESSHLLKHCDYPWKSMLAVILSAIVVQTVGFHLTFVFRDGMRGEKRDTMMMGTKTVDYMMTNKQNAEEIATLIQYCNDNLIVGKEAIFYGDAPGLSYLLRMPFAISTSWPDLDSYPLTDFEEELENLGTHPFIIIKKSEPATEYAAKKQKVLTNYLEENWYQVDYENRGYMVYSVE